MEKYKIYQKKGPREAWGLDVSQKTYLGGWNLINFLKIFSGVARGRGMVMLGID